VTRLLRRASLRFYLRHPWQLALAIAGISLGVGVYVGISVANDSAARAFDVAAAQVRGTTTHRIVPLDDGLDERIYRDLVTRDGAVRATPVIEGEVGIAGRPDLRVPLVGIEPVRQGETMRLAQGATGEGSDFTRLIAEPQTALLSQELAAELGADKGSTLSLTIGSRTYRRPASTSELSHRSSPI
jgi:putative ABC transport system permease protein